MGDGVGVRGGAHPVAKRACGAFNVRGEWGVVLAVVDRVVANDVDDRGLCADRVVQVGQSVCQAGAQVEERCCRCVLHARVTVSGSGDYAFEQAQDAVDFRGVIEGCNEVHFRSTRVCKHRVDTVGEQGLRQAVRTVHGSPCLNRYGAKVECVTSESTACLGAK